MDRDTLSQMIDEDKGDGSRTIPVISDLIDKWGQDPILSRDPRQSEVLQVMRMMARKKGDDGFLRALNYLMDREKIMVLNIIQKQASTDAVLELLKERESKEDVDFERVLTKALGIDDIEEHDPNNEPNDPGKKQKLGTTEVPINQTPKRICKYSIRYSDKLFTCRKDHDSRCGKDPRTGDFYLLKDCEDYEPLPDDEDVPTLSDVILEGIGDQADDIEKILGTTEGDDQ